MKARSLFALAVAVVSILSAFGACGPDKTPAGGTTFKVGPSGTSIDVTMQDGLVVTFVFPASAAGKELTIRQTSDPSLDKRFTGLLELLPHGTTFSPPVRVITKSTEPYVLESFPTPAAVDSAEVLPAAASGDAHELAHFSIFGTNRFATWCATRGGTFFDTSRPGGACCVGGTEHDYSCELKTPCVTWTASGSCMGGNGSQCAVIGRPARSTPGVCSGSGDAGTNDSGTNDGSISDGSPFDAAVGGCPELGKYTMTTSGVCGDLNVNAPNQRHDGMQCQSRWEFDTNGLGVSSNNLAYNPNGITMMLPMKLGSTTTMCNATVAGGKQVKLDCGACTVFLQWYSVL